MESTVDGYDGRSAFEVLTAIAFSGTLGVFRWMVDVDVAEYASGRCAPWATCVCDTHLKAVLGEEGSVDEGQLAVRCYDGHVGIPGHCSSSPT